MNNLDPQMQKRLDRWKEDMKVNTSPKMYNSMTEYGDNLRDYERKEQESYEFELKKYGRI